MVGSKTGWRERAALVRGWRMSGGDDPHSPRQASTLEVRNWLCPLGWSQSDASDVTVHACAAAPVGKLSPVFLYANCISFPHPLLPASGDTLHLILVSCTYLFSPPPSFPLLSLSFCLSLLVCTCVSTARAGGEPAAAFSSSRPASKH